MKTRNFAPIPMLLAGVAVVAFTALVTGADPRAFFPAARWKSDNGAEVGRINQNGDFNNAGGINSGQIRATNGFSIHSNAVALWPTSASVNGGAYLGNSNGTVFLLTSTPTNTAWAATNKLGP